MQITPEEIKKKFESLPEDIQWLIMGANVDDNIIEIAQEYKLNVEQMDVLALEIHKVMLGFVPPDKFNESLKNSLGLDEEKTAAIANAINEKILKKIREKMKTSFGEEAKEEAQEEKDARVLGSAGIEIVPEKPELNAPSKDSSSILAQKLSGFSKNEIVKTEHTLENITKNSDTPVKPTAPSVKTNAYPPNADPYRLPPE